LDQKLFFFPSWEVRLRLLEFIDNGNTKVAGLPAALGTDFLYPQEISLVLIFVRG
jgi:hypothetical protein